MTTLDTPAATVAGVVQTGRERAAGRPSGGAARTAGGTLRATCPPVSTRLSESGWGLVAPADLRCLRAAVADAVSYHENQTGRTPVAAAYRRILRLLGGHVPATRRQDPPGGYEAGENVPDAALAAVAEALDGSERKLLLNHLADSDPDVVAAGIQWLADYHAANAERRRVNRNREAKERRRRQRAGTGVNPADPGRVN